MENRNQQPVSGTTHGNLSVVLGKETEKLAAVLRSGPLSPEQLADILDEPHTRRAWWLDLHTSNELLTGTTINDLDATVAKACPAFGFCALCGEPAGKSHSSECPRATRQKGSNGQPAVAPFSFGDYMQGRVSLDEYLTANGIKKVDPEDAPLVMCLRIDHAHTVNAGCFELRPFRDRQAELEAL
jgi:hypothetical protein